MNGRRPIQIPSIYTRDSSISSHRPSTTASSISTLPPAQPAQVPPQPQQSAPAPPPAAPQNGVLLIIIGGTPNSSLKSYVQTALTKGSSITEVLVLGEKKAEQALKELKVDMYGLAGSMQRELGVQVEHLQGDVSEEVLNDYLGKALKEQRAIGGRNDSAAGRRELHGVICDLDDGEVQPVDVLEVESAVLMKQWLRSVGFVHTIARSTIPLLRVAAHRAAQSTPSAGNALKFPVFTTTLHSSAANSDSMHIVALRALLEGLSTPGNRDITFGSAEVLLAPEPEPVRQENQSTLAPTNGWSDHAPDSPAEESPTKLWGMWSMQQEIGNF